MSGVASLEDRVSTFFHENEAPLREGNPLFSVAVALYRALREKEVPKHTALSSIKASNLAPLLTQIAGEPWSAARVTGAITAQYKEEAERLSKVIKQEVPAPFALRVAVFEAVEKRMQKGKEEPRRFLANLYRARARWGQEVRFSIRDLLRGVRLPDEPGLSEGVLAGYVLARSFLDSRQSHYTLTFDISPERGGKELADYFVDVLQKFHLSPTESKNGKNYRLRVHSKAFASWIYSPRLPNFLERNHVHFSAGFLAGVIGHIGTIEVHREKPYLYLLRSKGEVIYELASRALKALPIQHEKGYPCSSRDGRRLHFGATYTQDLCKISFFNESRFSAKGLYIAQRHLFWLEQASKKV